MLSMRYFLGRFVIFAVSVAVLLLLIAAGELSAQSEEELVEKAAVKMKAGELDEAAAILIEAQKQYPSSYEIAKLTVKVFEALQVEPGMMVEACRKLAGILQKLERSEGKLSIVDRSLLKKTQKKLAELVEIREEVDVKAGEFVSEGLKTCRKLHGAGRAAEASFVYQRLKALAKEPHLGEVEKLGAELKEKADLIKRPAATGARDTDKAGKLAAEAQKLLKWGRLEKARAKCEEALAADPAMPEVRAILCDIAQKEKKPDEMLTHGLSYLLFHPYGQSAKRAEEIEKRISKISDEFKRFMETAAKSAAEVGKLVTRAVREKRTADVQYALECMGAITHRTRKMESVLSKARSFLGGERIFDGESLAGWSNPGRAKVSLGCLVIESHIGDEEIRVVHTGTKVRGSFILQFSLQVMTIGMKTRSDEPPTLFLTLWEDGGPDTVGDIFYALACQETHVNLNLLERMRDPNDEWKQLGGQTLTNVVFVPGRWYSVRIEYSHKNGNIRLFLNGKRAATVTMPKDAAPERAGFLSVGQQFFKYVKFRDIYLGP